MKIISLFGNRNKIRLIDEKGLTVTYEDTPEKNYIKALTRKKINDLRGALLYCDKIIELDPFFQKSYILKMKIFFELKDYQSSMFNLLDAVKIDLDKGKDLSSEIYDTLLNVFEILPKEERDEFIEYFRYFKRLIKNDLI
jgi:tetratricopeptide (TPR) repeat protein